MSILSLRHKLYRHVERLIFRLQIIQLKIRQIEIKYGSGNQLVGLPRIQLSKSSALRIGSGCTFRSQRFSNPIAIDNPITFCTLSSAAEIVIGDRVGISGGAICARKRIEIGNNTLIGANTYIFDNDFHALEAVSRINDDYSKVRSIPVYIGANVFIGARCIILKGVTIGDNAIIRAGSVVAESIPANSIAAGNPCLVLSRP